MSNIVSWTEKVNFELEQVIQRREKQLAKWGLQDHNIYKWNSILMEEVGELAEATLNLDWQNGSQEALQKLIHEAIDVAAVAIAIAQAACRKEPV